MRQMYARQVNIPNLSITRMPFNYAALVYYHIAWRNIGLKDNISWTLQEETI